MYIYNTVIELCMCALIIISLLVCHSASLSCYMLMLMRQRLSVPAPHSLHQSYSRSRSRITHIQSRRYLHDISDIYWHTSALPSSTAECKRENGPSGNTRGDFIPPTDIYIYGSAPEKPLAVISIIHHCYPLNHKLHLIILPPSQIVFFCLQSVIYFGTVLIIKYCGLTFPILLIFKLCITTKNCSLILDPSHFKCIINLLLFLATFYDPKCKFSKKTPFIFILMNICIYM